MRTLGEGLVSHIVQSVLRNRAREIETLKRDASKLEPVKPPFPRITYEQALEILRQHVHNVKWGDDFGGDEETTLSQQFDRPAMIHRYPASIKPFYMEPNTARPDHALRSDRLTSQ